MLRTGQLLSRKAVSRLPAIRTATNTNNQLPIPPDNTVLNYARCAVFGITGAAYFGAGRYESHDSSTAHVFQSSVLGGLFGVCLHGLLYS